MHFFLLNIIISERFVRNVLSNAKIQTAFAAFSAGICKVVIKSVFIPMLRILSETPDQCDYSGVCDFIMMKDIRCWWQMLAIFSLCWWFLVYLISHQYLISVTKIQKVSPTHLVPNIDVGHWSLKFKAWTSAEGHYNRGNRYKNENFWMPWKVC